MKFVPISYTALRSLQARGYNLLTSNNNLTDDEVYWYPEKVDDIAEYFIDLDVRGAIEPLNEPNLLPIHEALDHIPEDLLMGWVFVP